MIFVVVDSRVSVEEGRIFAPRKGTVVISRRKVDNNMANRVVYGASFTITSPTPCRSVSRIKNSIHHFNRTLP